MAATNYTPISLYYSTTAAAVPVNTNLVNGELAINITDGKLFYKDNSGVVQVLATKSGVVPSPFTANGVVYASSTSALATGSALTFDGSNKLSVLSSGASDGFQISNGGATPATFRVYTGALSYGVSIGNGATGGGESIRFDPTTNAQIFNTSSSEQMRLTSTGLGIGTSSPTEKLHVAGAIRATGAVTANATGGILAYQGSSTVMLGSWGADVSTYGAIQFYQANSTGTINRTGMLLDSSGNLGIGTTSPSASAILDAQSTTKGVRMPNMTTTQKNAISSPAAGLMVFDTTLAKLCVYSGSAWQTITSV